MSVGTAESLRLMVVAGEESGDAHAAALVRALRGRAPGVRFEFFGATGRRMREAGVESVVRADDLGRLNAAFFTTNAFVSVILLATFGGACLLRTQF
jgi:hypothetical protein